MDGPSIDREARARTLTVLAVAMAGSIPMYVFVSFIVAPTRPAGAASTPLAATLIGAAVLAVVAGFFVRRSLLAAKPVPGRDQFLVAMMVAFLLFESATILGFVASLLTRNPLWTAAAAPLSLAAMAATWPTRAAIEQHAAAAGR